MQSMLFFFIYGRPDAGLPYQTEILAGSSNQYSACLKGIFKFSFFLAASGTK